MRWVVIAGLVAAGLASGNAARAEGVPEEQRALVLPADDAAGSGGDVLLVQEAEAPRPKRQPVGSQDFMWVLSGAAGALLPLVVFAVPALVAVWLGPFAPLAFLVAIAAGALATAAGGAVAWLASSIFTNLKSGFALPVLYSSLFGLASTFSGGVLAALTLWGGIAAAYLLGGKMDILRATTPDLNSPFATVRSSALFLSAAAATVIWGAGVIIASVGGPMVAAFTYRARGKPKVAAAPAAEVPPAYQGPATTPPADPGSGLRERISPPPPMQRPPRTETDMDWPSEVPQEQQVPEPALPHPM